MEKFKYCLPLRVRFADTDLQGHVFFGNYLTYFDEALTGYLRAIGFTYADLLAAGTDMVYIHSECDYVARAFFEEMLNVHARIGRIGGSSMSFEFAAVKEQNDELVATGRIVAVCVDPESKKPAQVPEGLRRAVAQFEAS